MPVSTAQKIKELQDILKNLETPKPKKSKETETTDLTPLQKRLQDNKELILLPEVAKNLGFTQDIPEGWMLKITAPKNGGSPGYSYISPEGKTLSPEQIVSYKTGWEEVAGQVWDYENQEFRPASSREIAKREQWPAEIAPEKMSPEEYNAKVEAIWQEKVSLFKGIYPEAYEGWTEEQVDVYTQSLMRGIYGDPEIQTQFLEDVQAQGRTPSTEKLLKILLTDLTEQDLSDFFAPDVMMPEEKPEAVLQLEPEWENIRTGEIITKSEKARRYPKGYEAELDEWHLTAETAKNYGSVFKVFGQALTKVPKQLGAAILQAIQGQGGASVVNKDWADEFIGDAATDQQKFVGEVAAKYGQTRLPINMTDLAELPSNMAFSLASMGAGLAVGVPVGLAPVPGARVAAWSLGTLASGAVAYNLTTYQITQQYLEVKNEEMMGKVGRGLTLEEENALKKDFSNQAARYGLWEAVPEALSNLAFAKILTMPLGKMVGRNIASKIISKIVGLYGEELLTETITQKGQSAIEVEAGLRDGKISWVEAFKEIAPQTFLLTTVLGGMGQVGVSSVSRIKQSLKKEVGESPLHDTIKDNITGEVFAEVEAEAVTPEPTTAPTTGVTPTEVTKPITTPPVGEAPVTPEVTPTVKLQERFVEGKRQVLDPETMTWVELPALPKAEVGMPEAVAAEEVAPIPEKAANIRLEKYPEEVRPLITEWAETHGAEVREATRGVVSDAQVLAEAERLTTEVGGDLAKLRKKWKPATAWNAEELVAIRSVLRAKTQEVIKAHRAAKENNSTQNLLKLELALKEQGAVQEMVHGLTAEAGRALRSFRQEAFDALKSNDVSHMEELLRRIRGNRENTEKIAEMLGRLDPSDPIAVNKFIQELYKPHVMDYLIEIFYNSILSGPKTHIVNSLSNTANAIFSPIERFVSALVDLPLAAIEGRPRARFLSEVPADIFGAIRGIPEGFRQFAYVIKNGISFDQATKWEFRQKAFRGKLGAVISMPSRFLEGADALMKAINQRAALNAEAHRIASMEKLSGQAFEERVADLISSPTETMLSEANRVAEYRLFRQPPGKFGQTLMNLRDAVSVFGIRPLRFVIPFIRTPLNLVKFGLERTPLGFLNPKLWANVAQKDPMAADQIARATIGAIGLATLSWYFAAGLITGAPPRDRAERDRFYREGKQPYAIRVDGFWVSYQRLEPFNQLLGMVAIIGDMIRNDDKGVDEKILDAINTFGQNFISQTYMSSVSDLLEMLSEPERYAGKWLNRFASSMVIPMSSATRTAAQMFDQVVRDPDTAWETIEASIPGLSTKVKSKLSTLGEDIERKSPPWFPISVTPVEETILSQELERLEFDIGFAGITISGIELTDDEQREYQILSGKLIKADLEKLMVAPEYWQATDAERDKILRKVVDSARDWSRAKMRENIWTKGTTEDRVKVLETALFESDKQLGKVISEASIFTHEPVNIYDMEHELDSSYRAILQDIPESAIKGMKLPPGAHSWYVKEESAKTSSALPNVKLIDINADTGIGKNTFEDYYNQWQKRSEITDERELEAFDKEYDNAHLGNFSRRGLEFLRQYHKLDKKGQEEFLAGLSEQDRKLLTTNAYDAWLRSHPEENAQLAIWGQAKIITKEAYNEFNKLIRELDIVDSVMPKLTLPPPTSVDTHFEYQEMVAEGKQGSWEAQYLLRKDAEKAKESGVQSYVEWRTKEGEPLELSDTPMVSLKLKTEPKYREIYDKLKDFSDKDSLDYKDDKVKDKNGLTERDRAVAELKATNIEGDFTYYDMEKKVEALEKGTDESPISDDLVNAHVEYFRLLRQPGMGATSAEVQLFRIDNDAYNQSRINEDVWGSDAFTEDVDRTQEPRWRLQVQYREEYTTYEDEIPQKYKDTADVDLKVPKGYSSKWWDEQTPTEKRDILVRMDRATMYADNEAFQDDARRVEAYEQKIPEVEEWVEFNKLPLSGKSRDRYIVEHGGADPKKPTGFAKTYSGLGKGNDLPDPTTIPSVRYDEITEQYQDKFDLIGSSGDFSNIKSDQWKDGTFKNPDTGLTEREQATYDLRFDTNGKLTAFGKAEVRREGYKLHISDEYINRYVDWRTVQKEGVPTDQPKDKQGNNLTWYEDDWYLIEHPAFYENVYVGLMGYSEKQKEEKDKALDKAPSREVFDKYAQFVLLPEGKARLDFRWNNRDLDSWMLKTKKVSTSIAEQKRRASLTPREKLSEELQKWIDELNKIGR